MADHLEVNTFGIEETSEQGLGDQDILNSLFSDGATTDPKDIKEIKDEEEEPKEKKKAPAKAKKEEEDDSKKLIKELTEGEEEDEEEEEEPVNKEEEKEEPKDQPNPFNAISKELFELGVFTRSEGETEVEINDPQAFLERFKLENKRGAARELNDFLGQFGEDYQQAFQAIYVKGVNPREFFQTYNNIEDISNLDLTQEANQVAVVRQTLRDQGFESDDINAEIEKLKNYEDLESTAQRYHKALVKKETARLSKMESESEAKIRQQAELQRNYENKVVSILQEKLQKKDFDGIPINPNLAAELKDYLITNRYKSPSGETLTQFDYDILKLKMPENHEKKVKLGLLLKIMEKDPTLSTIQNKAVSKKADTLFAELSRQAPKSSAKTEKSKTPVSSGWFNL